MESLRLPKKNDNMRGIELIPTIGVSDLDAAIVFYQKIGFKKEWKWPEDAPTHASVFMDNIKIMMARNESAHIAKADLYLKVEDVLAFHKEIQGKVDGVSDLEKTDYGMLEFVVTDPWGHIITFGEVI
jgi:uncharacterized glyoxalase superfamily protein PhnB